MSIDYTTNEYVKIGNYTNVVNEIPKHKMHDGGRSTLYGDLDDLVYRLALKHPEWQFVGEDSWWSHAAESFSVKRIRVYEDGEQIGHVCVDSYREERFEIRNPRVNAAMAKRTYKATKDVNKALKIIETFFSAKTTEERVSEARGLVSSTVQNNTWAAIREFDAVMNTLSSALAAYITLNMDRVRPILESYGAPGAALDRLMEKNERRKLTGSIISCREAKAGTTVILQGDEYMLLHDSDPNNPVTLTASQLDDNMRGKLGVLKIVDDMEIIESVGVRIKPTLFYLLP